jgi:hypothetical protein
MYYVTLAVFIHLTLSFYLTLGNVMGAFFDFAKANRDYDTQLGVELSIHRWLFGFDCLSKPDHFLIVFYFFGLEVRLTAFPKEHSQ